MSNINNTTHLKIGTSAPKKIKTSSKTAVGKSAEPLLRLVGNRNKITKKKNPENLPAVIPQKANLPATIDFENLASASQLLAKRFTVSYSPENYEKSVRELSYIMLGLAGFILFSFIGWKVSQEINFLNGGDFIYNTGLIGGILMLLTLPYSAAKRITYLSRRLTSSHSYYMHIVCGGIGALLIMIHSSFDFRSINSSVAIAAMLAIIVAGALGRYLYTHFTILLHRLYMDVKSTEADLYESFAFYKDPTANRLTQRLSDYVQFSFSQPRNFIGFFVRCVTVIPHGIYTYMVSSIDLFKIIRHASKQDNLDKQKTKLARRVHNKDLKWYIFKITKMGYLNLLEQLFRNWRILHVPLLYILFTTAIVHVVVVHMY